MGSNSQIPRLLLEQYLLGELDPRQKRELDGLLTEGSDGARELAAMREENKKILAAYPARKIEAGITARLNAPDHTPGGNFNLRYLYTAASLLIVLAGGVIIARHLQFSRSEESKRQPRPGVQGGNGVRIKGGDLFQGFIKQGGAVRRLRDGEQVSQGDIIELLFRSQFPHGVVLSIDGRGSVTLHFPRTEGGSTSLAGPHPARAYELDDAPDFERFFFLTGKTPLDVAVILKKARGAKGVGRGQKVFGGTPGVSREHSFILIKR